MHVLLIPIGSHGDVHPFVGLGLALRDRGHRVTLITNGHFAPLAERVGLPFVELGTDAEYRDVIERQGLWDPVGGFKAVVQFGIVRPMRPTFDLIAERYVPGETVVAAQATAFGARLAQEKLGVPLATVNLQPALLRSAINPPVLPFFGIVRRLPAAGRRLFYRLADARFADPLMAADVNGFRAELGLRPVRRFLNRWWFSPQLVLNLFPDWFAPPAPDWPPNAVCAGFPLYDEGGIEPLDPEVEAFLAAGEAPVAFTPGSANTQAAAFFAAAVDACRRLGRRGMLLTRFADQVPAGLPDGVRRFGFVPFGRVLPRVAALAHHGGIGTSAQALAAGIPQLVMPLAHDQPDNAARLERLGVARTLRPRDFRGPAVAERLRALLDSPAVAARCREVAEKVRAGDPLGIACAALERLGAGEPVSTG